MMERIEGLRKSMTAVSQQLQAPKSWIGSGSVNLFQVVCDILDLLQQMNTQLAAHTHSTGPAPSPIDVAGFKAKSLQSMEMAIKLKSITL